MLCACDHLTEFALAADVFNDPASLYDAAGSLEINVPIPLSLSEFITAIATKPPMNWVMMGILLILMRGGLHYADNVSKALLTLVTLPLLLPWMAHSLLSH